MGWTEFYSQGEFTGDEDMQGYAMRVALWGIISLALPLFLTVSALVVGCTGKISLQSRWVLVFFLPPALGMLAWATVLTATASPIQNANLAVEPLQQWGSDAVALTATLRTDLQTIITAAGIITCGQQAQPQDLTNAINAKEDALTQLNSLDADASSLNDELNDFTLDSYIKYDDNINLYGPIGIGAGIILPILFMAVLWPLNQRKIIPSCPATTSIVFSIMAFVFLWILSTAFIPAIVAYSDACNSIDTVVKRISNEDSLRYYIDCDPTTQVVFEEFQTKLTTARNEANNAQDLLQVLDETGACAGRLTGLVTGVNAVIALIENDATNLLSCSRLQPIYTTSKGIVCGDETYTLVLHLHQAFIGAFALNLFFWISLIVTKPFEYNKLPEEKELFI